MRGMNQRVGTKKLIKSAASGFTIVELLIVVVVIAILAAITIVAYNGISNRAKDASVQSSVSTTVKKLEAYKIDPSNGAELYPSTLSQLNITTNASQTVNYYYIAGGNYYCLDITEGASTYYQTSLSAERKSGPCPTTNGLISWWPLNGSIKNFATGDTAAVASNVTPGQGQNGLENGSYVFTGAGTSNINTNTINARNAFTFSVWVYPTTNTGYQSPLSEARDCCGSGYRGFELKSSYSVAGAASLALWAGGSGSAAGISGVSSTTNAWNHYAGSYDGATLRFYKDGVQISSAGYVGVIGTPTVPLYIGRPGGTTSGAFAGRIDDVKVYDRALTAVEVATLFAAGGQ